MTFIKEKGAEGLSKLPVAQTSLFSGLPDVVTSKRMVRGAMFPKRAFHWANVSHTHCGKHGLCGYRSPLPASNPHSIPLVSVLLLCFLETSAPYLLS